MVRKYHNHKLQRHPWQRDTTTIMRPLEEDNVSKTTSSLFPAKMIAKLEWIQSNAQQNIEQLQNPTMGETMNNESITAEPPS